MACASFLFTGIDHDLVTNLASAFGLVALVGTFIGLYQAKWYALFTLGLFNLLLVGLNNYLYYSRDLILYLPFVQKISFAFFLLWISWITIKLYRDAGKAMIAIC